jgi:hypothetical protein
LLRSKIRIPKCSATLTRIIREGDEGTPSREFFEERQGKKEAEKGREESPGSIFRQEPTGLVFQG